MAANSDTEILVSDEVIGNGAPMDSPEDPTNVANSAGRTNLVKSPLTNSNITATFVVTFDTRSGMNGLIVTGC